MGKALPLNLIKHGRLLLSKKPAQGFDLFSPLMEGFIEIIQGFIEIGMKYFSSFMQTQVFKRKNSSHFKVDYEMLDSPKKVTDETDLGWSINQKRPFRLDQLKPHLHTFIVGASGWGKSNILNLLMEANLQSGRPIIFIDPKGSLSTLKEFQSLCKRYDKKPLIFSEHFIEVTKFNFFPSVNSTQALLLLMRSFDWGEKPNQYYLKCGEEALKKTLDKLYSLNCPFGLKEVFKDFKLFHDSPETKGLLTQLDLLVNSPFGHLFDTGPDIDPINFKKIREEGHCVYIGISTMGYGSLAKTIGKMFVSELQTLAHNIGIKYDTQEEAIKKSFGVFIDEAGSVLYPDFIDLANKARSSGMNLTIAVQSYSDIEMISKNETLMLQLIECFSTWLIQKQTGQNAEKLSNLFGTFLSEKRTVMTEGGAVSDKGSLRDAHEFACHPDILKSIKPGQSMLLTFHPKDIHLLNIRDSKMPRPEVVSSKPVEGKKFRNRFGGSNEG